MAGYQKLINGCYYYYVRTVYGQAEDTYVIGSEGGTDIWQDAVPDGSNGNWSKALRYKDFGSSVYMFNEAYQGFYATLNQCNAAIQYGDKVEGVTPALKAEAYFLRAHTLFNIVENYGGKYLPLTPTTAPITSLPCSSVNEFYNTILSDAEYAMKNLPMTQSVTGHVIRAAAYHLYAKACLTYATYTDGLCGATALTQAESDALIAKALEASEYLIKNASTFGVKLYKDIDEVFDEKNNKNNAEALFVVTHSSIQALNPRGNYYNRVWKHFAAYNNNTSGVYLGGLQPSYATEMFGHTTKRLAKGNCYMEPSKKFLDLFKEKDGRYAAFFNDVFYVNKANKTDHYEWTKDDANRYGLDLARVGNAAYNLQIGDTAVYLPRKTYTQAEKDACRYAIYNLSDNYADVTTPKKFFPSLKKADCPSLYPEGGNASKPYSSADCIIFRLGETYLVAAEAAWRAKKPNVALTYINELRNRACIGHDGSLNYPATATVTQDMLLDEYALEMCGEWNRWTTLKRFRAFQDRIITQKFNPQITEFKTEYYLRPIAASEISLIENGEEFQNPGY